LTALIVAIECSSSMAVADELISQSQFLTQYQPQVLRDHVVNSHHESRWFESDRSVGGHSLPPVARRLTPSVIEQTSLDVEWPDRSAPNLMPSPRAVCEPWVWQKLPDGLMYHSYVAGEKEPRFGLAVLNRRQSGMIWEVSLGGRAGILRYGTTDTVHPEGWQLDIEGAALPRLNQDLAQDLEAADFRFGIPLTYRKDEWGFKFGYYHLSAHVGDEYLERNPGFERVNYVRESILMGVTYNFREELMGYAEIAYAFSASDGAEPLEFQFGLEWAPTMRRDVLSGPVAAANVHLREEANFGGSINFITGWQWRGPRTARVWRMGLQYYNGKSMQYEFYEDNDTLVGAGVWYDF